MIPRWQRVTFHLITALFVLACLVAAHWQWQRAHRDAADVVPDSPPVELSAFDPTTSYSGLRLSMSGRFDGEHQLLVSPRARDGQPGVWVLTPFIPAATTDDPAPPAFAVIRGWLPAGQTTGLQPPAGEVDVTGVLVADERRPHPSITAGSPPEMRSIDSGALAQLAGYPIRAGWLAAQTAQSAQPAPLTVAELPGAEVGLSWRNAGYAAQWVAFAGFALFFWNRFRRDHFAPAAQRSEAELQEGHQDA